MYYKDLETNAEYRYNHNEALKKQSAERLKKVAALVKLKKQQKKDKSQ